MVCINGPRFFPPPDPHFLSPTLVSNSRISHRHYDGLQDPQGHSNAWRPSTRARESFSCIYLCLSMKRLPPSDNAHAGPLWGKTVPKETGHFWVARSRSSTLGTMISDYCTTLLPFPFFLWWPLPSSSSSSVPVGHPFTPADRLTRLLVPITAPVAIIVFF